MYCIAIMFAKLSILLLYMKIFVPSRRGGVFWVNQTLIYVNALFYFGAVIALICQCIPRAKISNPRLPGRCTNVYLSFMISGVFNVLSDFFILAFPLWAIWHLQMPLKRKFGVSVVFATGVLYVPFFLPLIIPLLSIEVLLTNQFLISIPQRPPFKHLAPILHLATLPQPR